MNDEEIKKCFEDLFHEVSVVDYMENYWNEHNNYSGMFQRLYMPNETPPKRYGYSGEEV